MKEFFERLRWQIGRWHWKRIQRRLALNAALRVLCHTHTRDEDYAGFLVEMRPRLDWPGPDQARYVAAWRTVRLYLNEPTEPSR